MRRRSTQGTRLCVVLAGIGLVGLGVPPAFGDHPLWRSRRYVPCPPTPCPAPIARPEARPPTPAEPRPGEPRPTEPAPTPAPETALPPERGFVGAGESVAVADVPVMMGDHIGSSTTCCIPVTRVITRQVPLVVQGQPFQVTPAPITVTPPNGTPITVQPPSFTVTPPPTTVAGVTQSVRETVTEERCIRVVSPRSFKIAENESPRPLDRVYFSFNYFDEIGQAVNRRFNTGVRDVHLYRETFGIEKTFFEETASIGVRLPLNTLKSASNVVSENGSDIEVPGIENTDIGDLTFILKGIVYQNTMVGDLMSIGIAVTAPTGPDTAVGDCDGDSEPVPHCPTVAPFVGSIWRLGERWFLHGFSSIDIPTDSDDVTLLFNDIGIGHFLYRDPTGTCLITAIVPTFEVHVTNPLNHRGAFDEDDPVASADVVNLTTGTSFAIRRWASIGFGMTTPVTGPRPFDYELQAQFNYRY